MQTAECDVDLARPLPWNSEVFDLVVTQHVVEHLDVFEELIPCLRELRRCMKVDGEVWISCPDLEKVCKSYVEVRLRRGDVETYRRESM